MDKKTKKITTQVLMIAPEKLRTDPLNGTLFGTNETNFERLKKSIQENGFLANQPILCFSRENRLVIISGHRRRRAAVELGIKEIPVTVMSNLSEAEIERLIIEENLMRPNEGRKLSYVERYILALRLAQNFPEQRGGDRRSEDFTVSCESRHNHKSTGKDQWLSAGTGICSKYLSELSVIAKCICQDSEKAYPELVHGLPIYEQLQTILNKGLSQDLNDLHRGNVSIRKVYNKYKTPKKQSLTCNIMSTPSEKSITTPPHDIDNSSVSPFRGTELAFPEQPSNPSVVLFHSFKEFLVEFFVGHPNQEKAMLVTSLPDLKNPRGVST